MRLALLPLLSTGMITFCLPGCVTPASRPDRPSVVSGDLAEVRMPVLRSNHFEKQWGKPDVEVMDDGTYRLRYRQGGSLNFVIIESVKEMEATPANPPDWEEPNPDPEGTTPAPPAHKQSWKHTSILGKPVKWYQADGGSGADFPGYRTVDFQLTAPDGRSGFYHIEVCSDSALKAADRIHRVGWQ
ncbi:MAG: hypothetical protein V4584_17450 [Verrucomicrobiota bacterium]